MGSGSMAAMAVFESGYKEDLTVSLKVMSCCDLVRLILVLPA